MAEPIEVARFLGRSGKRVAVTVVGVSLLIVGVALMFLPGPGFLLVVAGLAVLATEYAWAKRMLDSAKARAQSFHGRFQRPPAPPAS